MKLGNAAWGFRETPLEEQLKITHKMGLNLLELSIAGHQNDFLQLDSSNQQIEEVINLFDKFSINLTCAATGNDFTLPEREDSLKELIKVKNVIDICNKLSISYLRIFAGFSPVEEVAEKRWTTMIECLCKVGEYAASKGVIPVIETHGGVKSYDDGVKHFHTTTTKLDVLSKMLEELPPTLMVNFDPANLYAVGIKNPENVYTRIKDRVCYVHLKDFVALPKTGHLLPAACGDSDMDWVSLLETLKDFEGPALIEYENVDDVEDGCRRSLNFLKKIERK